MFLFKRNNKEQPLRLITFSTCYYILKSKFDDITYLSWIKNLISITTNFNLVIKDTFAQYKTGNQTITGALNNNNFWGPTLIMNNGAAVQKRFKINQPQ